MYTSQRSTQQISAAEAARELLARRRARANFHDFVLYMKPEYASLWFHTEMDRKIQEWIDGKFLNLIFNMPPRTGKSERSSRLAPAYILGRDPNAQIIATSYSSDLAQRMNRDVQRIIDTPKYRNLFPDTRLNASNVRSDAQGSYLRNSDIFEIVGFEGAYRGAGRGGGVTGMGAKFIFIDDPIKDAEEAKSQTIKDAIYDWLVTTLFTRGSSDQARKMMTVTRWAVDDPVGRVLELCDPSSERYSPDAEKWEVLTFPALAFDYDDPYRSPIDPRAPGEPLWPDKFGEKYLNNIKAQSAEAFLSLYQQKPIDNTTRKFQRQWFKICNAVPTEALRVRYWDKAGTEDGGAYTVGTLLAFDGTNYYFEDVIKVQLGYAEREKLIKQTARLDNTKYGNVFLGEGISPVVTFIEQEPGSGGKESAERTVLALAPYLCFADRVTGDKVTRANGLSAQAESGNVKVLNAPWLEEWLREFENFPKGKRKDQVDSGSGAFNKLSLGWEENMVIVEDTFEEISPF